MENIIENKENINFVAKRSSKIKFIIAIIIFLFIIACAVAFFIFSDTGLKIVNYFYPTTGLTMKISEKEISRIKNLQEKITLDYGAKTAEGDGAVVEPSKAELNVKFPDSFPDSTAVGHSDAERGVIIIDNDMYVEDPYDNTYSAAKDSTADQDILNKMKNISSKNLQEWISGSANDFTLKAAKQNNIKILQLTSNKLPSSLVRDLDNQENNGNGKIIINISQNNYLPDSFSVGFNSSGDGIKNILVSFSKFNEGDVSIEKPALNEFGDFIARESIYLRTDPSGSHDYLWPLWEQKYFGCTQCVNKIWDEDGDGLTNVQEFIFGSDPKNKDSNGNSINDYEELIKGQNPITSQPLSAPYILAFKKIITNYSLRPVKVVKVGAEPVTETEKPDSRDGIMQKEITIPKWAKLLTFKYGFADEELSSYLTVFFDNRLLFKTTAIAGQKVDDNDIKGSATRVASFPVDQIAGQKGIFAFILNSVGDVSKKTDFLIDYNSLEFK